MRHVNWPLLALFVVVWLILGQLFMGHAVHLVSNMGIRGDNFGVSKQLYFTLTLYPIRIPGIYSRFYHVRK